LNDIDELRSCAAGVQEAMHGKDYEAAAGFIGKYLQYASDPIYSEIFTKYQPSSVPEFDIEDPTTLDLSLAISDTRSPLDILETAKVAMTDIITEEFNNAISKNDEVNIVRYFKLFPQIQESCTGLDSYAAYISGIVSRYSQDGMRNSNDDSNITCSFNNKVLNFKF
jgi:conserved oligomeric Golgi complex subunit 4